MHAVSTAAFLVFGAQQVGGLDKKSRTIQMTNVAFSLETHVDTSYPATSQDFSNWSG